MDKQREPVTTEQALEALDDMDDYAKMDIGVDPIGPRETLRKFILAAAPQGEAQAGETPRTDAQLVRDVTRLSQELVDIRHDIERQVQIGADLANEVESLRAQLAAQQADAERLRNMLASIRAVVPLATWFAQKELDRIDAALSAKGE